MDPIKQNEERLRAKNLLTETGSARLLAVERRGWHFRHLEHHFCPFSAKHTTDQMN